VSTVPTAGAGRPRSVRTVVALVALQALTLVAIAVFYGIELAVASPDSMVTAVASAVLVLVAGIGMALVAWGLARGRRWSRAPALVAQLLLLPVGYEMSQGQRWWLGLLLLLWAGAVAVLLFSRDVSASLRD
jgi:hypothetical protein